MDMEIGKCDLTRRARLSGTVDNRTGMWALLASISGSPAILDIGVDYNVNEAVLSALRRCMSGRQIDGLSELIYAVKYTDDVTIDALEEFHGTLANEFSIGHDPGHDFRGQ